MAEDGNRKKGLQCLIAGCFGALGIGFACMLAFGLWSVNAPDSSSGSPHGGGEAQQRTPPPSDPDKTVRLVFTYGSEKKKWIKDVTETFNKQRNKTADGKIIYVEEHAMGSGESIDEILEGHREVHLTSPARSPFITLGNARSEVKTGSPLIGKTTPLVLSPVVIAMWKPMAEALGWPDNKLGWADVIEMAKNEKGWAAHGHPEWGQFKFGHTNPLYSNSGLISILAEVYAGAGKSRGLSMADVKNPQVAEYLRSIELAVVHYGRSTGFFGRKMFGNGPNYLSAAVLYENMVVESYSHQPPLPFPVVAIYPKEGTFWSDHPVGIVERPYVTDEHRDAAGLYIDFLMEEEQQAKALTYGFQPGNPKVKVTSPIDAAHGVDSDGPETTLEVPPAAVIEAVIDLWKASKKHSEIVLVLDRSGSMKQDNRMNEAKAGALEMLKLLGPEDRLSLVAFSSSVTWLERSAPAGSERKKLEAKINGLFPSGKTVLYDATAEAVEYLDQNPDPTRIQAVVVLTDGADQGSGLSHADLLKKIEGDSESRSIRVFTIGYGGGAQADKLKTISDNTQAKYYQGDPKNIRSVFKDISTFF